MFILAKRYSRNSFILGLVLAFSQIVTFIGSTHAQAQSTVQTLADFDKILQASRSEADPDKRYTAYQNTLLSLDRLSIENAAEYSNLDSGAILDEIARNYLQYAASFEARDQKQDAVLIALREVLPRIRTADSRAQLYVGLARLELANGDLGDAVSSIRKSNSLLFAVESIPLQNEIRTNLVRLTLGIASISVDAKLRWAIGITDPETAREALRAIAMGEIVARRAGKTTLSKAAIKDPSARTEALRVHALTLAKQGSFQRATFAALAIANTDPGVRDATLGQITEMQLTSRTRPETIVGLFAISDQAQRNSFQMRVAEMAIDRGRLAIARNLLTRFTSDPERCRIMTRVSARLSSEKYLNDWQANLDAALASCAAENLEGRGTYLSGLALEAILFGKLDRATQIRDMLGGDPKQEIVDLALIGQNLKAGKIDEALATYATLESPTKRSNAAAQLYGALLKSRRFEEADKLKAAATEAADQAGVLIADARYGYVRETDPNQPKGLSVARLESAVDAVKSLSDEAARDEYLQLIAGLYADLGLLEKVEKLSNSASQRGKNAISVIQTRLLAQQDRSKDALAIAVKLAQPFNDSAFAEISAVLAGQGNDAGAFAIAKRINKGQARRAALRANAEIQANLQLTRQQELAASRGADRGALGKGVTLTSSHFLVRAEGMGKIRDFPDLMTKVKTTGNDIRLMAPAIAPGNATVVPTGFSNLDEKFSYIRYLNNVDLNGNEEQALSNGQGTLFPQFIYIENGVFDLPTLRSRLENIDSTSKAPITSSGRVYTLNIPLLIGRGATLVVNSSDVEELRLNTQTHAYIVNSGDFYLIDVRMTSWDESTGAPTPRSKHEWNVFTPFYTAWSGSKTYFADSHVVGMGYGDGKSYGISISAGPVNVLKATIGAIPRPTGIIVDSTFSSMYYAFYSYEADDFALIGNEYYSNEIYAIDPHDRTERLTIAYNTTYGTHVKHGIITSREVKDSVIFGNVSTENHGSGMMLDRMSDNNIVAYNSSFGNGADGLTIYESSCNLISGNRFSGNGRDGLKIRNSWDIFVGQNVNESNKGFGINVYSSRIEDTPEAAHRNFTLDPYTKYASMVAVENLISSNKKSAMRSVDTSVVTLARNRLTVDENALFKQSDLASISPTLLAMTGSGATIRDYCQPIRRPKTCHFVEEGYFGSDTVGAIEAAQPPDNCQTTN